ncbi:MAG TPA: FixH family protein, partial [Mucilaginibacter sp.]
EPATGTVRFIRPSSEALDKVFNLSGSNEQEISMEHMVHGRWQMVLEWQSKHRAYLYQKEIYVK